MLGRGLYHIGTEIISNIMLHFLTNEQVWLLGGHAYCPLSSLIVSLNCEKQVILLIGRQLKVKMFVKILYITQYLLQMQDSVKGFENLPSRSFKPHCLGLIIFIMNITVEGFYIARGSKRTYIYNLPADFLNVTKLTQAFL